MGIKFHYETLKQIFAFLHLHSAVNCAAIKTKEDYRHKQAQSKYQERNRLQDKTLKFKGELLSIVEDLICLDLSPEQISYDLLCIGVRVGHERIY